MNVAPLSPANRAAWDALVAASDGADLFHDSTWLLDFEGDAADGRSFLVEEGGRAIAAVPCALQRTGRPPVGCRVLASLGLRPAGPALAAGISGDAARRALTAAYERLDEIARAEGADALLVARPAGAAGPPPSAFDLEDRSAAAHLLDLAAGEEALWKGLEVRGRNTIRKAQKEGIGAEEVEAAGAAEVVHRLHAASYAHSHASGLSRDFFERLLPHRWCRVFVARRGGEDGAVSAVVTGRFRGRSRYWFAGSTDEGRRAGANSLALWTAILAEMRAGVRAFEVGEIRPGTPLPKVAALNRFKRQFGGAVVPVPRGRRLYRPLRWALWSLYCAARGAPAE